MRLRRRQHRVPELNTTSTADISFMLLIFFLVTTNMDIDKGITRQLPPADKQEQEESVVAKGTLMTLHISADSKLYVDDKPTDIRQLRRQIETFVSSVGKRHLVKVDASPEARYEVYFQVQNEMVAAYKSLRNAAAHRLFHTDYDRLSATQRDKVKEECPQRVAEVYGGTGTRQIAGAGKGGHP